MSGPTGTGRSGRLEILAVRGLPRFREGDDIGAAIARAAEAAGTPCENGDVLIVAQKAVSKAEGRVVRLADVVPTPEATRLAEEIGKDPAVTQAIFSESVRIVRAVRGVLIVETKHGLVCANAGVDASNVDAEGTVTLLPLDPDASARRIRDSLRSAAGVETAVIVSDSFNRPWRMGSANVAIGIAGMNPLDDRRGTHDDNGHELRVTVVSVADELASAAQLVMGEAGGVPAAIVRGFGYESSEAGGASMIRPAEKDLFR